MTHTLLSCLAGVLALTASAGETIFDFSKGKTFFNPSVPEQNRAVKTVLEKDGLRADYMKSARDTWPVINIGGDQLSKRNWTGYDNLVINVSNLSPEISPTLNVVIRSGGKLCSAGCWVRANSQNCLLVDLAKVAVKINPGEISMIQLAFNRPQKEFAVRFKSIELLKNRKSAPGDMISRVYDLRQELLKKGRGLQTYGNCRLETRNDGSIAVFTDRYQPGMDRWPGFQLTAKIDDALNNGDFSTKTHLVAELEELPGSHSLGIGLSFSYTDQKKFWHGFGSLNGGKVEMDRMIFDMGVDLKNIKSLGIGGTMPSFAYAYKINKLQLEFRPDEIQRGLIGKLNRLRREKLLPQDLERADRLLANLNDLYDKVKGEKALRKDIEAYINAVNSGRREVSAIQRKNGNLAMSAVVPSGEYGVGVADSMTSVFLEDAGYHVRGAEKAELEMAKNETESFQVVVAGMKKELKEVKVTVSELAGPDNGKIHSDVSVVGHARNKRPTYPAEYVGWYPDFLIEYQKTATVKPGENVPFWVRLRTPADAKPGIYHGTVTVSAAGVQPYSFPVQVKVYDFPLPAGSPLPSSNNFHMAAIRRLYKINDEQLWHKVSNDFIDRAAEYKITLDYLYRGPYTNLKGDGEYPALKRLNDKGELKSFCVVNSTVLPKYSAEVGNNPDHPEVGRLIERTRKHLEYWGAVAKKYGVWDKAYFYGFDEGRIDEVTNRVFGTVKKEYPALPVMTTAGIPDAQVKGIENIDIWVPTVPVYRKKQELVKELRRKNKQVWWYVCNFPRPPEPTLMLEVPAAVPRLLMGAMTQKYRPDGFLYWSIVSWMPRVRSGLGAVADGPRTNWNPATCNTDNEEGNLFVPGRDLKILPTIRIENFRDGVEDLWYYRMLEELVKQAERKSGFDKALLARSQKALAVPESLILSTDQYNTEPEALRSIRRELAECMEEMQKKLK